MERSNRNGTISSVTSVLHDRSWTWVSTAAELCQADIIMAEITLSALTEAKDVGDVPVWTRDNIGSGSPAVFDLMALALFERTDYFIHTGAVAGGSPRSSS